MSIVKPRLLEIIRAAIVNNVAAAKVTINNNVYTYKLFRSVVEGTRIRLYVYVDDRQGLITEAKLVDVNNTELIGNTIQINKGEDGYTIVFEFDIKMGVL